MAAAKEEGQVVYDYLEGLLPSVYSHTGSGLWIELGKNGGDFEFAVGMIYKMAHPDCDRTYYRDLYNLACAELQQAQAS